MIAPRDRKHPITVYTPDGLRRGGLRVWVKMAQSLSGRRELIWRLMCRDFSARYRQSILGYIWAIIPSVATVIIFTYLTSHRVLPIGKVPIPYPIFALWSISVWHLFSSSLAACTNSLVNAGSLVTKINFQKETLVIASVGQAVIEFTIRLLPIAAVMLWYGMSPPWQAILIPLILFPILVMAVGLGFFLSILNLAIRDIGSAVGMVLTFGMFAAPVLYPPPQTFPFFLVNILNPFSPLLIATQDLLAYGELRHENLLFAAVLFSFLLFMLGWRIFYITMPRVAERA